MNQCVVRALNDKRNEGDNICFSRVNTYSISVGQKR